MNVNYSNIMNLLYGENVWDGFKADSPAGRVHGWNGDHPIFAQFIEKLKAKVVIDVGVWKGLSTITIAQAFKDQGLDGCVIGVDTFLGSPEHWSKEQNFFSRNHGYPDLYQQFLSNIYNSGLSDYVVPVPQLSLTAAQILKQNNITAQIIHIDAAHEYDTVRADVEAYWEILDDGGYMVGDDYDPSWPGVVKAADEFANKVERNIQVSGPKWIIQK
jgi:predicted O-methyltransferase YrrM